MKKKENKWQEILENLVKSANDIPLFCSTPLSFNLKMLSVIADAAYVKRLLVHLLEKWKKELPLLSDEGMDVNWCKIKDSLCDFLDNAPYEMEFKSRFPDISIKSSQHIDENKWRKWEEDYSYGGEKVLKNYINGSMSKYLNPTDCSNQWYFAAEDLKKARISSCKYKIYGYGSSNVENWKSLSSQNDNIKRIMISMSIWENSELEQCIITEIEGIINVINDIILLLKNPQAVIKDEFYNFDKEAAEYFVRDYVNGPYNLRMTKAIKRELEQWYISYNKDLTLDLLENKLMQEFVRLLDSGFLDIFLKDMNCDKIGIEKTYLHFSLYFFDEKGNRKNATCGRYIYTNQMCNENWIEKTYAFYRYLEMRNSLLCEIEELNPNYSISASKEKFLLTEKQLNKREVALYKSIKQLMDEIYINKNGKKEPLVKLKKHWFPIFAVMSEKKLGAASGDYSTFLTLINRIAPPSGFRVKLSAYTLRKIVETEYNQPFEIWKYEPTKHGDDEERIRMTYIYKRFIEILKETGLKF